jgi:NitT/TauT family transport system substrate-binding protein
MPAKRRRSLPAPRAFAVAMAAGLTVTTLTACARGTAPDNAATSSAPASAPVAAMPSVKIMVGGVDKVIYLPAKLTEQLGYFKEEGVDVQLLSEPAGAQAETVLLSGGVQGVVGFYDHTVDLASKGKCVQSVVQLSKVPGEVEIVAKNSPITSAKDFKGKKMGVTSVGSSTDFLTRYMAVRAGLQTQDYTTVKAGAGPTFIAALTSGGIDAGMTTDPTVAKIVAGGTGQILFDMRTEEGSRAALGGLYPSSSLYMDCAYVKQNPETVQRVANALVRTLRFIHTHSAADIAAKMPADYRTDAALYTKAVGDSMGMFTADGVMPAEGPANVLQVLASFNESVIAKKDTIKLSDTFTTAFVEKVPAG